MARTSESSVLQIFIFKDGRFWGTECFAQREVVLGRDTDVDLRLDDEIVSRTHAAVTLGSEGLILEDLGSANGTFVNGEPIERCFIDARDEVGVGSFSLKLKLLGRRGAREEGSRDATRIVPLPAEPEERTEVVCASSRHAVPVEALDTGPEDSIEDYDPTLQVRPSELLQPEPRRAQIAAELREALALDSPSVPDAQPAPQTEPEDLAETCVQAMPEPPILEPPSPEHALAQAYALADEDELEEAELRDFVEPFSLLNNLIREDFREPVPTAPAPVVEIISYGSEKQVLRCDSILPGKKGRIGAGSSILVKAGRSSSCKLLFTDACSGGVIVGGQTLALDGLKVEAHRAGEHRGRPVYACELMRGDYANLVHEGGGSFVRFVHPPVLPRPKRSWKPDPVHMKIFGSTFAAHLALLCVLGLLSTEKRAAADTDLDRFAKVDIQAIHMDRPDEVVELPLDALPEPEKQPANQEVEQDPRQEPEQKPSKARPHKGKRQRAGGDGGQGGGGVGMLAALGNLSQKKSPHNIITDVTNLEAVRVPGGRLRYAVSGLVAKLPTSDPVLSRGQGVGVRGGVELLRPGKGRGGRSGIGPGEISGGQTGRRNVQALVWQKRKIKRGGKGFLSRDAIAIVVRRHLKEVQACYEKNLLLDPKLAGKVILEWVISTSGSVGLVRTETNTMPSPVVAICVSARIKGWKFPKPKGGQVVVSYPFIFNIANF
ncbi:MAG: AgmX/PglI C-terminal domain-containing protein [Deltaproteobacteria bacterium]|nr:AgmX/PglI C-terminal domain-containing protein [Deltaproteobacteria bacterium]